MGMYPGTDQAKELLIGGSVLEWLMSRNRRAGGFVGSRHEQVAVNEALAVQLEISGAKLTVLCCRQRGEAGAVEEHRIELRDGRI